MRFKPLQPLEEGIVGKIPKALQEMTGSTDLVRVGSLFDYLYGIFKIALNHHVTLDTCDTLFMSYKLLNQ